MSNPYNDWLKEYPDATEAEKQHVKAMYGDKKAAEDLPPVVAPTFDDTTKK